MPSEEQLAVVARWLRSAQGYARTAEAVLALDPPEYEQILVSAQQCVERSLKALITLGGKLPQKTHNLVVLLEDAGLLGFPTIVELADADWLVAMLRLHRYATEESEAMQLEASHAERALRIARTALLNAQEACNAASGS